VPSDVFHYQSDGCEILHRTRSVNGYWPTEVLIPTFEVGESAS
jgi:hypothetical protein